MQSCLGWDTLPISQLYECSLLSYGIWGNPGGEVVPMEWGNTQSRGFAELFFYLESFWLSSFSNPVQEKHYTMHDEWAMTSSMIHNDLWFYANDSLEEK